jgi:aspartate aminotransferase-like enzyme
MTASLDSSLLDFDPVGAVEVAAAEDAVAALLSTTDDVLLVQAEAILTLEAVARSIAGPETTAINVVTGPYGAIFGDWMRASGARVVDVVSAFDDVVTLEAVVAALEAEPTAGVLALVHAEAATGGTNPVAEIVRAARERGVVTVLDAVASIAAEPVLSAEWGVDVTVIGAQKSLAGPSGVSAVAVSDAAWALIDANPLAPRGSYLSLLDIRDNWTRTGRTVVLGTPHHLETRALLQALDRVNDEGLPAVIARHERARAATFAGVAALGLDPWQATIAGRAGVDSTVRIVPGLERAVGGIVTPGNGPLATELLRINHTGRKASLEAVSGALEQLAAALGVDAAPALAEAARAYGA